MPREPQQQDQKGTSSFQLVSLIRRRRSLQNNHQTIRDGTTESTRGEGALKAASAGAERCGAGIGAERGRHCGSKNGRTCDSQRSWLLPPRSGEKRKRNQSLLPRLVDSLPFNPGSIPLAQLGLLCGAARRGECQLSSPKQKPPTGHGRNNLNCSKKPFHHRQVDPNICAQRCPVPSPGVTAAPKATEAVAGAAPGSLSPTKPGGRGHMGGRGSRLTVGLSPWGPGAPCSNMASKVALTVKCTNATQDTEATMLLLPGHGTNATRYRNTTHMDATAASVTAHPPLAGRAWHALLLGIIFFFYII